MNPIESFLLYNDNQHGTNYYKAVQDEKTRKDIRLQNKIKSRLNRDYLKAKLKEMETRKDQGQQRIDIMRQDQLKKLLGGSNKAFSGFLSKALSKGSYFDGPWDEIHKAVERHYPGEFPTGQSLRAAVADWAWKNPSAQGPMFTANDALGKLTRMLNDSDYKPGKSRDPLTSLFLNEKEQPEPKSKPEKKDPISYETVRQFFQGTRN